MGANPQIHSQHICERNTLVSKRCSSIFLNFVTMKIILYEWFSWCTRYNGRSRFPSFWDTLYRPCNYNKCCLVCLVVISHFTFFALGPSRWRFSIWSQGNSLSNRCYRFVSIEEHRGNWNNTYIDSAKARGSCSSTASRKTFRGWTTPPEMFDESP